MTNEELRRIADTIRYQTIRCISSFGTGHIGGSLSLCEAMAVLYYDTLRVRPEEPDWPDRDYLVLSKGHAGPVLYAALALKGYFPMDWLDTLNRPGTRLPSHCDRNNTPGVDMSMGSLGQGLGNAVGLALGWRLTGKPNRAYVIVGDGELDEGSCWESLMALAHYRLDNVTVLIDRNGLQSDGPLEEVMNLDPLEDKLTAFGLVPVCCDGHDVGAIRAALASEHPEGRPLAVILNTVKGKGWPGEGHVEIHNGPMDAETAKAVMQNMEALLWQK